MAVVRENDLEFLQTHLARIRNERLYKIVVGLFYIDFVFGGNIHTIIRIKKCIQFTTIGEVLKIFDFTELDNSAHGSGDFIKFIGRRCKYAKLDQYNFELVFKEGGSVSVAIDDDDFEPLEFIGTSGPHGGKLEFYIVL